MVYIFIGYLKIGHEIYILRVEIFVARKVMDLAPRL